MIVLKTQVVEKVEDFDFSGINFPLITVYWNTLDQPGKAVARLWDMDEPTPQAVIRDTVEELQKEIDEELGPMGAWWLERMRDDDPCVVGVWML